MVKNLLGLVIAKGAKIYADYRGDKILHVRVQVYMYVMIHQVCIM